MKYNIQDNIQHGDEYLWSKYNCHFDQHLFSFPGMAFIRFQKKIMVPYLQSSQFCSGRNGESEIKQFVCEGGFQNSAEFWKTPSQAKRFILHAPSLVYSQMPVRNILLKDAIEIRIFYPNDLSYKDVSKWHSTAKLVSIKSLFSSQSYRISFNIGSKMDFWWTPIVLFF